MCEWRGRFAREAVDIVKAHIEAGEEFVDEDGTLSKEKVIEFTKYMLEYTDYGYRFIYMDTDELVSSLSTIYQCYHSLVCYIPYIEIWIPTSLRLEDSCCAFSANKRLAGRG